MSNAFWSDDHILISKAYHDPEPHSHLAIHLIFSAGDAFECVVDNTCFVCKGICIQSNTMHTIACDKGELLVFLFDKTSNLAKLIEQKYLMGEPYCRISEELAGEVCNAWRTNCDDAKHLDNAILSVCHLLDEDVKAYDARVHQMLKLISEMQGIYENTIEVLSRSVYLSRSRAAHLFKEQVGISLSSYLVFEKMRKAYTYIVSGDNITGGCIRAGFSSSSHFSNVCKKMFGIPLTEFLKATISQRIK